MRAGAAPISTSGWLRPGDCPELTIPSASCCIGAWPIPCRTSVRYGTTAIPMRFRALRPPIFTAIPLSRSIPTQASWPGITSILPGDDWDSDYTHERTLLRTRLNPDPKYREVDQSGHHPTDRSGMSRSRLAKPAVSSNWIGRPASFSGPRRFLTTIPIS